MTCHTNLNVCIVVGSTDNKIIKILSSIDVSKNIISQFILRLIFNETGNVTALTIISVIIFEGFCYLK